MNALPQSKPSPRGCGICGATSARELYTARDRLRNSEHLFIIARCDGCGVLRTLPEMSDDELAFFYPHDYWGGEPSLDWIRKSQAEKTRFLAGCEPHGGRILDVGCGAGFFLRALDPTVWDPFGIETGATAAAAAERIIGMGRIFNGTLIDSACEEAYFDVLTFWSALEHTNEPRDTLIEARRVVKRGGTLIVQVPNAASYQARWFGGDWFALDAPRHRYHFTAATLTRLLGETGFQIVRTSFHSKAHNTHALRQSLKAKLYSPSASAMRRAAFLACLPFIKPFDFLMSAIERGATLTLAARAV
jgi:2-polyprenyl-3-methyl-5-hydroxy-6-metoxy-1,4-benzoquinol methylase